ncbi:MAG: deoxynucleoside kinase [Anaerolineales bacterium]|nr:deoxynucleoside kinase [Anaerolineales bacterium]MBX3038084.1 deoxynucleoside kinase [Anaerolineales bacterium]
MKPLIVIIGASGVGKTTLMQALCKKYDFAIAYETHDERPFQKLFKQDTKYALANQLDYLIHKAEQEKELRQLDKPALMDGGLDLDFHGFTRLFHAHAWLSDLDLDLCRRLYNLIRSTLPPPELIVMLHADEKIIRQRLATRNRINIASSEDADLLEKFISEWLESVNQEKILRLDVSKELIDYTQSIEQIMEKINGKS